MKLRPIALLLIAAACGPRGGAYHPDGGTGAPADLAGATALDLGRGDLAATSDLAGAGSTFGDQCPMGTTTTVRGTVFAPNGVDPVARGHVYLVQKLAPIPTGVACDACDKPFDLPIVETTAGADGSFTLGLDGAPFAKSLQLVVAKGRFRRASAVAVACGDNAAPKLATTLPGRSADGDLPKIAVGTGTQDHLDQVLDALGITEFTCLEGRKSASKPASCTTTGKLSDLLTNANGLKLGDYNMVFIGCAPGAFANYPTVGVDTSAIAKNLGAWAAAGGRLFVTDNSYDYLAAAFPTAINWQGPQAMPWTVAGADVGVGGTVSAPSTLSAHVDDPDLATWLKVVGVAGSPQVTVGGILNQWSVMSGPLPKGTALISNGTATWSSGGQQASGDVPLTAQLQPNQCGKVVYSSYHTLSTVNQNMLSAQEKILEYLMLDAAACTHM